jgi:hypothetical protein
MLRTASEARCFVMGLLRYESDGAMIAGQRHGLGEQLEGQAPRVIIGVADVGLVGAGGFDMCCRGATRVSASCSQPWIRHVHGNRILILSAHVCAVTSQYID